MSNRLQAAVPGYPIQQYYGDYQHFTQNKAKEWGDICGTDRHVCTFADYPGGDVNATPNGLVRTGVNTRMNRFIDHYASRLATRARRAAFDVTAALRSARRTRTPRIPRDEPGDTFTAPRFSPARSVPARTSV